MQHAVTLRVTSEGVVGHDRGPGVAGGTKPLVSKVVLHVSELKVFGDIISDSSFDLLFSGHLVVCLGVLVISLYAVTICITGKAVVS